MPVLNSNFGVGRLYAVPAGATATPVQFGVLQDAKVDLGFDLKKLYGQNSFPADAARGKGHCTIKAKVGQIYGSILSQLILGGSTQVVGGTLQSQDETSAIPGTPFAITVAQSATWVTDLGVYDITANKMLAKVASAPITGQYSVSAGVYTFAAADTTHRVAISYTYSSAATGQKVTMTNQLMGSGSTFQLLLGNYYNSRFKGIKFFAAICPKISFDMKNEDFTMYDLDFEAFADASGNVYEEYEAF